jgi:hypothetical protein
VGDQRVGAAGVRLVHTGFESLPGIGAAVRPAQRGPEVDGRAGVFEPGGRGGQHLDGLLQGVDRVVDQPVSMKGHADRSGSGEPPRETHGLLGEVLRLSEPSEQAQHRRGSRTP